MTEWFTFPEITVGEITRPTAHVRLERVRAVEVYPGELVIALGAERPLLISASPESIAAFLRALGIP